MVDRSCPDSVELREFALGQGELRDLTRWPGMWRAAPIASSGWRSWTARPTSSSIGSAGCVRLRTTTTMAATPGARRSSPASPSRATSARESPPTWGATLARRLGEGSVQLDRFELRSELGVGSFGYVFQAWDPRLQRVVALKVQRAGSLASQEEVERFLREARSAAQLKHPSIVSMYETAQTEDNVWFLVCEYIDGVTLEQRLSRRAVAASDMPPTSSASWPMPCSTHTSKASSTATSSRRTSSSIGTNGPT